MLVNLEHHSFFCEVSGVGVEIYSYSSCMAKWLVCDRGTEARSWMKQLVLLWCTGIKTVFNFTWQFGNTCYCNSVLQALYFCRPFRENVLSYKAQQKKKENLLTCLADLFHSIATQKKKVGVIPPKKFISRLRKENGKCKTGILLDVYTLIRKV